MEESKDNTDLKIFTDYGFKSVDKWFKNHGYKNICGSNTWINSCYGDGLGLDAYGAYYNVYIDLDDFTYYIDLGEHIRINEIDIHRLQMLFDCVKKDFESLKEYLNEEV